MRRQAGLKRLVGSGLAACACAGILPAQSAWAGLGVSDATGKQIIEEWIGSGYLNASPTAKAFKAAAPASRAALVARRLQEFLDVSKDVDFDAKLVPAGKLMRFADPRYEEKPSAWILCFRSGREAVAAAREAPQAWLKGLARQAPGAGCIPVRTSSCARIVRLPQVGLGPR